MGCSDACELPGVLAAIFSLELPMAERRRLASRAVALVLMPAAKRSEPEPGLPGVFEDILLKVGSLMGKEGKASVSEAKAFLRGFGGPGVKMASRLGKLSSGRNAVVHDGFTLAEELAQLVRGCSSEARKIMRAAASPAMMLGMLAW